MLPELPLLQLVPSRAARTLDRIRDEIWQPAKPLPVEWAGTSREHVSITKARKRQREAVSEPFYWGELEDQAWFRISIPAAFRDGTWFLEWKEQGESTAYVKGVPHAGLDIAHHNCRIPKQCREIWMEVMALETGIWLLPDRPAMTPDGCRFEGARARQRNELAWEVYHDLEVLYSLLEDEYKNNPSLQTPFAPRDGFNSPLTSVSVLYRQLARGLEDVVCAYERAGLTGARKKLKRIYASLKGRPEAVSCRLSGHAHIDLVWLWTEKAGEFKAVHTFSTANRLMEEYPEFRFGYSQPPSYRAVERRSPALMKAVSRRIKEGRWEAVGASEVEFDTLLPCGEALARALLLGQEEFRRLQGKPSEVLWLPDVFGYSACLPQLMKQTGVSWFFTTKLHWSSISVFPYSSFIWQGSDGSEVVSHISHAMGYLQTVTPAEARKGAREYRQSDVHDEFLMPSGYGDGGGGPTQSMCERARRMADLAGTPPTAWGRIDDFFEGLEKVRDRLPEYRGELYLQFHRGVLTTQGKLKKVFRRTERALQAWEAAHVVSGSGEIDKDAWRRLVFAQFHDYIPGSSIPQVYAEAIPELQELSDRAFAKAGETLQQESGNNCLFNPLPLPMRTVHRGKLRHLPPLSGRPLKDLEIIPAEPVIVSARRLRNERLDARFDAKGRIRSLKVDGEELALDSPLGSLVLYPDKPHAFEVWELDRSTLVSGKAVTRVQPVEATTQGASGVLAFEAEIGKASRARIRYVLDPASPVLRVEYDIDWKDPEHLLKVLFPTGYNGGHARYGDPFGSSLRSQQPGEPYDEAQWEVPGSRFAIVCDDGLQEGLFVVTESKYGWSCRSGTLGLSLLRSAPMPTSERATIAGEGKFIGNFSDLQEHRIRLALGRFRPDAVREESPAALAELLFAEPIPYKGQALGAGFMGMDGGPSLVPCWSKPDNDDSWTLRLHETLGQRGHARICLAEGWKIQRTDLSGNPYPEQPVGGRIRFSPCEIVSLRFRRTD